MSFVRRFRSGWIALALFAITLGVFARCVGNRFIDVDDPEYVMQNSHVAGGLSAAGWRWAWTTYHASNWHPLTWLSLQLDAQFGGLSASAFHLTNVLLHAAAAALLFVALSRMSGAVWRSALVAALFALHPLHVQSVAWVAERKDALSGLLAVLTLLAYAWYVERPGLGRYACVLVAYGLGLTAKPMLVTLPCVLLLLDYWPLARWGGGRALDESLIRRGKSQTLGESAAAGNRKILLEKVPLLVLAAFSCLLTWQAEREMAVVALERLPLYVRLENTVASYVAYLWQTVWPSGLMAYYPLEGREPSAWTAATAAALLLAVTLCVLRWRQRAPYLAVGWFWYLGMLVPVIGIVQVGTQARADRYTYLPLIGIFIAFSWGVGEVAERFHCRRVVAVTAAVLLACCAARSWIEIGYWRDGPRLWERALEVDPDNPKAHLNLAASLGNRGGDLDPETVAQVTAHLRAALKTWPYYWKLHYDLGVMCARQGNFPEAVVEFERALQTNPQDVPLNNALGHALIQVDRFGEAAQRLRQALAADPSYYRAHYNLGLVLERQGHWREAAAEYRRALELQPNYERAAQALERLGQLSSSPR